MSKKYILIAEDDAFLAGIIKAAIKKHGLDAKIAKNGNEAIDAIADGLPSILLLDLLMPELDGYGVLDYLKKNKYKIPVVVMTNIEGSLDRKKCKEFGCKGYIIKSEIDDDDLWPAIEKYVQ